MMFREWSLAQNVVEEIFNMWDKPHIDLFATRQKNTLLPEYCSLILDPRAEAIDALSIPWTVMFACAFTPPILLPKVLKKIKNENCVAIFFLSSPFHSTAGGRPLHHHSTLFYHVPDASM